MVTAFGELMHFLLKGISWCCCGHRVGRFGLLIDSFWLKYPDIAFRCRHSMSVEVLVSKPTPSLIGAQTNMKEQLRTVPSSSSRSGQHKSSAPGHHLQPTFRYPSADVVRNPQDMNGHPADGHQHFDHNHIIYDSLTDTTYLRGRLLGKVSVDSYPIY